MHVDVVVMGAGPAGSTAANLLARAGIRVVVFEREAFPRFHIGESLLPASAPVWERLGVRDALDGRYLRKLGTRFIDCRTARSVEVPYAHRDDGAPRVAYHVPRADFDQLLAQTAERAGAELRWGWAVREVVFERDAVVGVRAMSTSGEALSVATRVVIDATGRDTLLASRVGRKLRIPGLDKSALFGHFVGVEREVGAREGFTEIATFPHGWFWHIPFRGEVGSVGMVCSSSWMRARRAGEGLEAFFARTIDDVPWMKRRLRSARRLGPMRALGEYSYRVDRLAGNGWILVGDAAGFADAAFCSGALLAFRSAEVAADLVASALAMRADVTGATGAAYESMIRGPMDIYLGASQALYAGSFGEALFDGGPASIGPEALRALVSGDVLDVSASSLRDVRERFPPTLPSPDAESAPPGASRAIE